MSLPPGPFEVALLAFACAEAAAAVSLILLIRQAGAVFASQKAYTVAIAGVAWSTILLSETMTGVTLVAVAVILAGLYFVARKAPRAKFLIRYEGAD